VQPRECLFEAVAIKADVIHSPGAHTGPAFIIAKKGVLRIRLTSGRKMHNVLFVYQSQYAGKPTSGAGPCVHPKPLRHQFCVAIGSWVGIRACSRNMAGIHWFSGILYQCYQNTTGTFAPAVFSRMMELSN